MFFYIFGEKKFPISFEKSHLIRRNIWPSFLKFVPANLMKKDGARRGPGRRKAPCSEFRQ